MTAKGPRRQHSSVKHALLEKLHAEVFPALEALVTSLPTTRTHAEKAERQIRAGALAAARLLLAAWGQTAEATARLPAEQARDNLEADYGGAFGQADGDRRRRGGRGRGAA